MSDTTGAHNDGTVDQLLREAGLDDDVVLRPALLELRGLADGQPQASAEVAALMAPLAGSAGQAEPAEEIAARPDELAARRRAKRRITLTTLSLAASLAAGGAVAAASDQGVRDSISQLHHAVTSFVPFTGGGPAPDPVETPAPAPEPPGTKESFPASPAGSDPAAPAPVPGPGQGPQHTPAATNPGGVPPRGLPVPENPVPENPAPENATSGVTGGPLNGEGQRPNVPLPATPPVPVPGVHP